MDLIRENNRFVHSWLTVLTFIHQGYLALYLQPLGYLVHSFNKNSLSKNVSKLVLIRGVTDYRNFLLKHSKFLNDEALLWQLTTPSPDQKVVNSCLQQSCSLKRRDHLTVRVQKKERKGMLSPIQMKKSQSWTKMVKQVYKKGNFCQLGVGKDEKINARVLKDEELIAG